MLTSENEKKQKEIDNITKDRDRLSSELENIEKERKQIEEEKQKEFVAKQKAERINSLYRRRDELKNLIERTNADIIPYEKLRKKSFCNWLPFLFFTPCAIIIMGMFVLWGMNSFSKSFIEDNIGLLSLGVACVGICVPFGIHFITNSSLEKRRTRAYEKWEVKDENAKYKILQNDLYCFNEELKSIEDELKNDI